VKRRFSMYWLHVSDCHPARRSAKIQGGILGLQSASSSGAEDFGALGHVGALERDSKPREKTTPHAPTRSEGSGNHLEHVRRRRAMSTPAPGESLLCLAQVNLKRQKPTVEVRAYGSRPLV